MILYDFIVIILRKGSKTSQAIFGFNYVDMMVGTIELTMIKEEKIWKTDSLAIPKSDRFTLQLESTDQAVEKKGE